MLVGGAALILARLSVATVVQVQGDGMAPAILDGDHILVLRGRWTLDRGDVIIYDPTPAPLEPQAPKAADPEDPNGSRDETSFPDNRKDPRADLRNTAVVEIDELEDNWQRVQRKSDGLAATVKRIRAFRVGRILAMPGDTVTFHAVGSPLGVAVNGQPLQQKPGDSLRLALRGEPDPAVDPSQAAKLRLRATAFEAVGDRRYQVLVRADAAPVDWSGLELPPSEMGPVQIHARGYLVLADNRDQGACCDSRAIGWVPTTRVRGEVVARLGGDPNATPDLAPDARGFRWSP